MVLLRTKGKALRRLSKGGTVSDGAHFKGHDWSGEPARVDAAIGLPFDPGLIDVRVGTYGGMERPLASMLPYGGRVRDKTYADGRAWVFTNAGFADEKPSGFVVGVWTNGDWARHTPSGVEVAECVGQSIRHEIAHCVDFWERGRTCEHDDGIHDRLDRYCAGRSGDDFEETTREAVEKARAVGLTPE